jgi:hypothetical protein
MCESEVMTLLPHRRFFGRSLALAAICTLAACGGGGGSSPATTPIGIVPLSPGQVAIASNGSLQAQGAHGTRFTFLFGSGVPAGEWASVTPGVPANAPHALSFYQDALTMTVGPQPLPASAFLGVSLSGLPFFVPPPGVGVFETDFADVADATLELALPTAPDTYPSIPNVKPSGTIAALQPGHTYEVGLFTGAASAGVGIGF